jgi:YHS domain-containing protein
MTVETPDETVSLEGLTLGFCSAQCRETFARAPQRYLAAMGGEPSSLHQHSSGAPA